MTTFTDKNVQNLQSLSSANTHWQHSSLQLHRISGAKNSHSVCPALTFCFSGNDVNATNKSVRLKVLQWVFGVTRSAFYLLDTMQKSTIITWWQTISVCLWEWKSSQNILNQLNQHSSLNLLFLKRNGVCKKNKGIFVNPIQLLLKHIYCSQIAQLLFS